MSRVLTSVLAVVVLLAVAGGSFFGGSLYGRSQAQATLSAARQGGFGGAGNSGANAQGTPGARRTGGQGGGFVMGQIDQVAAGSLVLTDNNGKQTKVLVTNTTLIQKQASVALSDLKQGETVVVSGSAGTDGSITARSVQVSPAGGVGGLGGGPGGGRTTNPTPTP
jgi:Domain of unknown function (DUF5666)